MTKYVRFTAGSGDYAVAAERVLQVRSAVDIIAMPSPAPQVAGLIRFDAQALTVVTAFSEHGAHVLIVDGRDRPFGFRVDQVTGVVELDPATIGDRPRGQLDSSISGVIADTGGMTMVVDLDTVANLVAS